MTRIGRLIAPVLFVLVAPMFADTVGAQGSVPAPGSDKSGNPTDDRVVGNPPPNSIGGNPPPERIPSVTGGAGGLKTGNTNTAPGNLIRDLSQAPLFALVSGVASILGLLLALYATQVRTIPFSFYRSLMWRKVMLISLGTGLLVFAGMKFYAQEQAPFLPPFTEVHAALVGELRVSNWDYEPHGPVIWPIIFLFGAVVFAVGLFHDPAALARRILVREQDALHHALDQQITHLLRGRKATDLEPPDSQILADTLEYYRHIEWRFADVVLGAPPPAFPLFYERHQQRTETDA